MAEFVPNDAEFAKLKDRVVVLTGAATGIGAATATLLYRSGAKIVFGDVAKQPAEQLVKLLTADDEQKGEISFVPCDVTKYDELYALFKTAHDKYGQVNHAISCAGIFEQGAWFDPSLTIESIGQTTAPTAVIDINVMGSANFARIAVVFLRDGLSKGENRSLTLLSSVNAFRESPGLYMYQTSKHAIQGLMRAMRKIIYERDGIRVNCVCPGVTDTPMTVGIVEKFRDAGLYTQSAESVGRLILAIQCAEKMNGKAIYCEGGDGWEFEDSFYRTQPQWLGEEPTRRMRINSDAVNKGALIK